MTVAQVRGLIQRLAPDDPLWGLLERDARRSVRELVVRQRRRRRREEADQERRGRMLAIEQRFWGQGVARIAGVDEVGRGCLAGPVVAAAVILPPDVDIPGLDDSKKLTPARRELVLDGIQAQAVGIGRGQVESAEIDALGIMDASLKAMRLALSELRPPPEQVLVDGPQRPGSRFPEMPIIDGDALSLSVAAASVVAKVYRDRLMADLDSRHSGYGFAKHKGYGSPEHLEALRRLGPCPLHRRSFAPVACLTGGGPSDLFVACREGISRCGSIAELEALGGQIRQRCAALRATEVDELRRAYRRQRQRLGARGARGEALAAEYLTHRGYVLLERGWRGGGGEIDLIVGHGDERVFVEVKTSHAGGLGRPEDRVDDGKRRHLVQAAQHYLREHAGPATACRFDVVSVVLGRGEPTITHLPDAFRP